MSKHTITIEIDLTEDPTRDPRLVLDDIANAVIENLTENYGIISYQGGQPEGYAGYDGPFVIRAQRIHAMSIPEDLAEGLKWWAERHPEDPVAMTADNQDALILTERSGAQMGVAWVDPTGLVRTLDGPWTVKHRVQDLSAE
jgi:hypothetical protein